MTEAKIALFRGKTAHGGPPMPSKRPSARFQPETREKRRSARSVVASHQPRRVFARSGRVPPNRRPSRWASSDCAGSLRALQESWPEGDTRRALQHQRRRPLAAPTRPERSARQHARSRRNRPDLYRRPCPAEKRLVARNRPSAVDRTILGVAATAPGYIFANEELLMTDTANHKFRRALAAARIPAVVGLHRL